MALETLGAVCAVGQLMGQCSYVLEVVDKLRRSTETLKGYRTQLQDLRGLCEVIKGNPSLQTTEVISHAQSILETTEQHDDLTLLLQKRRLHRVWAFLRVERRLVEHTKNIENLKSALVISIQDQQCRILNNIDKRTERISAMQNTRQVREDDSPSNRGTTFDPRFYYAGGNPGIGMEMVVLEPGRRAHAPQRTEPKTGIARIPESRTRGGLSSFGHHTRASQWTNNTAHAGVSQVNGTTVLGLTRGGPFDAGGQHWAFNRKDGPERQINGYVFESSDDHGYVSVPKVQNGYWHDNEHTNRQHGTSYGQGTQHNGHIYQHGVGRNR